MNQITLSGWFATRCNKQRACILRWLTVGLMVSLNHLGGTIGPRIATAMEVESIVFTRNLTCNFGLNAVMGWPVDICDGRFNVTRVQESVDRFKALGILDEQGYSYDQTYIDSVFQDCAPDGYGDPFYCSKQQLYDPMFGGASICENKMPHGFFDSSFPSSHSSDEVEVQASRPHGCSVTCNCCGSRCSTVRISSSSNTSAAPSAMILYLHPYTGDSTWATSMYQLQRLVEEFDAVLVAPNGREDDLALSYWLATDHFTGFFLNKMDTQNNNTMQERYMSDDFMQHNATDEEQYEAIANMNHDLVYLRRLTEYVIETYNINREQVYVVGGGLGADMALMVACNMSDLFMAVVSHNGKGLINNAEKYCRPESPMHVLVFQQEQDPEGRALKLVEFWAKRNKCQRTQPYVNPNAMIHLVYDRQSGSRFFNGSVLLDETAAYQVDYDGCDLGGSVTLWQTQNSTGWGDVHKAALDPETFPLEVWAFLTTHPRLEVDVPKVGSKSWFQGIGHYWLIPVFVLLLLFCLCFGALDMCLRPVWKPSPASDISGYGTFEEGRPLQEEEKLFDQSRHHSSSQTSMTKSEHNQDITVNGSKLFTSSSTTAQGLQLEGTTTSQDSQLSVATIEDTQSPQTINQGRGFVSSVIRYFLEPTRSAPANVSKEECEHIPVQDNGCMSTEGIVE